MILHWKDSGALCQARIRISESSFCSHNTGDLRYEAVGKLGGEYNGLALFVERGVDVERMQNGGYCNPNRGITEVPSWADPVSSNESWFHRFFVGTEPRYRDHSPSPVSKRERAGVTNLMVYVPLSSQVTLGREFLRVCIVAWVMRKRPRGAPSSVLLCHIIGHKTHHELAMTSEPLGMR